MALLWTGLNHTLFGLNVIMSFLYVLYTSAIVSEFFIFYISIVYYIISQLPACTSDTCILKDQSINQSINIRVCSTANS